MDVMSTILTLAQSAEAANAFQVTEKINVLLPEIVLLLGGTICLITGLGREEGTRKATAWIAGLSLIVAGFLVPDFRDLRMGIYEIADLKSFIKLAVCILGFILLLVSASVPDQLPQTQKAEKAKKFDPANIFRGEYFAFFLFSLVGVMLTAGANDLVWLFLALELTSLPTYVMVTSARQNMEAQEAGVKYFFLGALSSAIFLYGFTLLYGATGYTELSKIARVAEMQFRVDGTFPGMLLFGMILSVIGICFKIAAFPMHYYTADVYQGASSPVSAFLAFVPKAAGFAALILILSIVGWNYGPEGNHLPHILEVLLWVIAVVTMTVGNILGLVQRSVKRVLAYSSIAHSGYMVVGLLAGPRIVEAISTTTESGITEGLAIGDGIAAIIFYLIAYGLATVGAFAILACLRNDKGDEIDTFDELSGGCKKSPSTRWHTCFERSFTHWHATARWFPRQNLPLWFCIQSRLHLARHHCCRQLSNLRCVLPSHCWRSFLWQTSRWNHLYQDSGSSNRCIHRCSRSSDPWLRRWLPHRYRWPCSRQR